MRSASEVDTARKSLGPVGAFLPMPFTSTPPVARQREAARRLEVAGFTAAWLNEPVGGKDPLVQAALLLDATERLTLGTGIANVWARAPQTAHAGAAMLAETFPGRFVLGLGVGYPAQAAAVGREFGRPLATMRDYLQRMDAPGLTPAPEASYLRIVAANGPKMAALGGELADGAMPAGLPAAFTQQARQGLGPDKLLVVAMSVPLDTSDPDEVAAAVTEHRAAGADHVILMPPMASAQVAADLMTGVAHLERLAPAVLSAAG